MSIFVGCSRNSIIKTLGRCVFLVWLVNVFHASLHFNSASRNMFLKIQNHRIQISRVNLLCSRDAVHSRRALPLCADEQILGMRANTFNGSWWKLYYFDISFMHTQNDDKIKNLCRRCFGNKFKAHHRERKSSQQKIIFVSKKHSAKKEK